MRLLATRLANGRALLLGTELGSQLSRVSMPSSSRKIPCIRVLLRIERIQDYVRQVVSDEERTRCPCVARVRDLTIQLILIRLVCPGGDHIGQR